MSSYYKIKRDSEIGKRLGEQLDRRHECQEKAISLCERYGFDGAYNGYWTYFGGLSAFANPKGDVDMKLWKIEKNRAYTPRQNTKAGKAIAQEMKDIPCVHRSDINDIFGLDIFSGLGIIFSHEEYIGVSFGERSKPTLLSDMEEITKTEYESLNK